MPNDTPRLKATQTHIRNQEFIVPKMLYPKWSPKLCIRMQFVQVGRGSESKQWAEGQLFEDIFVENGGI